VSVGKGFDIVKPGDGRELGPWGVLLELGRVKRTPPHPLPQIRENNSLFATQFYEPNKTG